MEGGITGKTVRTRYRTDGKLYNSIMTAFNPSSFTCICVYVESDNMHNSKTLILMSSPFLGRRLDLIFDANFLSLSTLSDNILRYNHSSYSCKPHKRHLHNRSAILAKD